ncbi:MAG: hypothetical protein EXR69_10700 [Myxococcales bacterium]|nr:hypothetical protein [Myxococcales bacterium]
MNATTAKVKELGGTVIVATTPIPRTGEFAEYTLVGDAHDAGNMTATPGTPPHWLLYASVENADAIVALAQQLGARLVHGPADIPTVGRFAILMDPVGAAFAVMHSASKASADG